MHVCVCVVTVSLHRRHTVLCFFMLHIQKRSLVSVNEMMLNRPQGALAVPFGSQASGQHNGQRLTAKKEEKNEEEETPLASNQNGSGFLSSLFALSSVYPPLSLSSAITPAGRCNLLPFTPCQRMTMFAVTTHQPWGERHHRRLRDNQRLARCSLQSRPQDGPSEAL